MPLQQAKLASPGTSASNTVAVLQNWDEREFIEGVQLGLAQLTSFLNDFGKCIDHTALSHRLLLALAAFFKFDVVQYVLLPFTSAEATTRSKLSALDTKLSKLERRMDTVEATLQSVDQGEGA